MASYFMFR